MLTAGIGVAPADVSRRPVELDPAPMERTGPGCDEAERTVFRPDAVGGQDPVGRPFAVTVIGGEDRPRYAERVRDLATEAAKQQIRDVFVGLTPRDFRIVLHRDASSLPEGLRDELAPGTPGFALRGRDEIHLVRSEIRPPRAPIEAVVAHEVVHVLLDQYAGAPRSLFVPRWFHEGLAQQVADHGWLATTEDELYFPARAGTLIRWPDLRGAFPRDPRELSLAYAQSRSFVTWLVDDVGTAKLLETVRALTGPDDFARALSRVGGGVLVEHEGRWRDYIVSQSGAGLRFVADNCFGYVGIIGFVLLALAAGRHYAREGKIRDRLEAEDREDDELDAFGPRRG